MTTRIAGVFPGQGSQAVGMGRELGDRFPIARDTFAEADDILGFSLSAFCFDGPVEELKRTSIAQPALVTMSTALWRVLVAVHGTTLAVAAGHSLGEYSALVAAGALTFPDALRLVRRRGMLMEDAATAQPGGMVAVIGASDDDVAALCAAVAAHGVAVPANYNAPGQVVVSGESAALDALRALAKERRMRTIPLPVSGAFHSPLMQPAADAFAAVLRDVPIAVPAVPVVPNVTAQPTTNPVELRDALARQITGSVHWTQSVFQMRDIGVTSFLEIGPGNVLSGLIQRILPDSETVQAPDMLAE